MAARRTKRDGTDGSRAGAPGAAALAIRAVRRGDLPEIVAIDAAVTGIESDDLHALFRRYGVAGDALRQFLVAEDGGAVVGFVIGEVRDWEFGSPRCGWVFGIGVRPDAPPAGVGTRLLRRSPRFSGGRGSTKVRTMLARDNQLILSFFRSQGMMAAPFIPLEIELEPDGGGRR